MSPSSEIFTIQHEPRSSRGRPACPRLVGKSTSAYVTLILTLHPYGVQRSPSYGGFGSPQRGEIRSFGSPREIGRLVLPVHEMRLHIHPWRGRPSARASCPRAVGSSASLGSVTPSGTTWPTSTGSRPGHRCRQYNADRLGDQGFSVAKSTVQRHPVANGLGKRAQLLARADAIAAAMTRLVVPEAERKDGPFGFRHERIQAHTPGPEGPVRESIRWNGPDSPRSSGSLRPVSDK
jgi:hypothetical protein